MGRPGQTTLSAFAFMCLASSGTAQSPPQINAFQFFEYALMPLAVKWSCGGDFSQDLAQLERLILAYPEDARKAELQDGIEILLAVSQLETGVEQALDLPVSEAQKKAVCAAALPLRIDWLTPQSLIEAEGPEVSSEQKELWLSFFQTIEALAPE